MDTGPDSETCSPLQNLLGELENIASHPPVECDRRIWDLALRFVRIAQLPPDATGSPAEGNTHRSPGSEPLTPPTNRSVKT